MKYGSLALAFTIKSLQLQLRQMCFHFTCLAIHLKCETEQMHLSIPNLIKSLSFLASEALTITCTNLSGKSGPWQE